MLSVLHVDAESLCNIKGSSTIDEAADIEQEPARFEDVLSFEKWLEVEAAVVLGTATLLNNPAGDAC